ncbi:papain family cysteine protease [Trichuris suis]|nr:papain family cysteine protease [Trichuris suis]
MTKLILHVVFLVVLSLSEVNSDTPAECYFEDIVGTWIIYESENVEQGKNCSAVNSDDFHETGLLQLIYPNAAIDKYNNLGTWTMIYNQGFEVRINNRVYFAFSKWKRVQSGRFVSICDETLPGWLHDVHGHDWTCFVGKKLIPSQPRKLAATQLVDTTTMDKLKKRLINNKDYIDAINRAQSRWTAKAYKEWETATWPTPPPSSTETKRLAAALPEQFDWRNVSGVNYVSDVRDQRHCGSCYIFASVAVLESRYRILTQNEEKPTFSPQDVLNCSPYAQGCDGGFPFLIAGKHAEDFGMVTESCEPYLAHRFPCKNNRNIKSCKRYYATNYQYVGGYYGALRGNEDLIKLAVYHNGPVAVGIQVYPDFYSYHSGIYYHVKDAMNFSASPYGWNPFLAVDHAVTVVGYGVEKGTKYWIVKNSWGKNWGDNGYVKILRGTNECGIESLALESTPIIRSGRV